MSRADERLLRVRKTILTRMGLMAVFTAAGFLFPLLFIVPAWLAWTIYEDLRHPDQSQPNAWLDPRQAATSEDANWKSVFMEVCESPAETAFLEAMISEYRLVPVKGILKGDGIALDLQVEIKPYRADFLADDWLVIEIDGAAYHSSAEAIERDRERDRYLVARGYTILRIPAKLVLSAPLLAVGRVRSAITKGRHIERAEANSAHNQPTLLQLVAQAPKQAGKFLDDMDRSVSRAKAIERATYLLDMQVSREKSLLQSALVAAREQMQLDIELDADEDLKRIYYNLKNSPEDIDRGIDLELKRKTDDRDYQHLPTELPNFAYPIRHSDPDIADGIEHKIREIQNDREMVLGDILNGIAIEPKLRPYFERNLQDLGGEDYLRKLLTARGR